MACVCDLGGHSASLCLSFLLLNDSNKKGPCFLSAILESKIL
jgi:hypothetical protein